MCKQHETRTHHYINGQSTTLEQLPTKVQIFPWAGTPRSLVRNCHFLIAVWWSIFARVVWRDSTPSPFLTRLFI